MADVTISNLNLGVPAGSHFIPYSTGSETNRTLVSSITAGIITTSSQLVVGTTAQRPSPASQGAIRFNTTINKVEIYDGSKWGSMNLDYGPYSVDILLVAGGGAGGGRGGGGGGGVIVWQNATVNPMTSYSLAVGAGGSGTQGGNSSFTLAQGTVYTAVGGGFGASHLGGGGAGGSGGGGGETGCGGTPTAGQGFTGGCGKSGGHPYAGGAGGGYASAGANYSGAGGTGYALDAFIKQVPPFNNLNGEIVTHVSSGGGWNATTGTTSGVGGPGAGGSAGAAKWYGCGGCGAAGFQGIIVIRYSGTQRGTGGNFTTYNSNDDKTYHVFTAVGSSTFISN